ncbi:FAD-dependent monooxygenase [Pedomonas mirosovicensis]|uniref:FAD-dependent monooxygenase n=1 Tax=Pedomonas mirosovicensis TaxID=2908641 RepID=UPI0021691479|nr:FAD-dependent monooxygenase [Pedomonas mirosovicensis]MCH8684420.1 FAD-dependent monooxygenase [Pedomonas mirosovicensis]
MTKPAIHFATNEATNRPHSWPNLSGGHEPARRRAVVVGGSLAGLMSALALSRVGLQVTVLERSDRKSRTGAALEVSEGLLERLTGRHTKAVANILPTGAQAWADVHAGLRSVAQADPNICIRSPVRVACADQDERGAWAVAENGEVVTGDIVVGADGHASVVRQHVAPESPDAKFAGYLIWLGLVDEHLIRSRPWPSNLAILYERDYCLNAYYLPGPGGTVAAGKRRIGWGWYDARQTDLLRASGCLVGNVVQRTLRPDKIPRSTFEDLAAEARDIWPDPWREAILHCIERREVIGTPVAEYMPKRLIRGRVCLVGDAAHVPSPMTGRGFAASALDALALAEALERNLPGHGVADALCRYETKRLEAARDLVLSGQSFSRSFAPR